MKQSWWMYKNYPLLKGFVSITESCVHQTLSACFWPKLRCQCDGGVDATNYYPASYCDLGPSGVWWISWFVHFVTGCCRRHAGMQFTLQLSWKSIIYVIVKKHSTNCRLGRSSQWLWHHLLSQVHAATPNINEHSPMHCEAKRWHVQQSPTQWQNQAFAPLCLPRRLLTSLAVAVWMCQVSQTSAKPSLNSRVSSALHNQTTLFAFRLVRHWWSTKPAFNSGWTSRTTKLRWRSWWPITTMSSTSVASKGVLKQSKLLQTIAQWRSFVSQWIRFPWMSLKPNMKQGVLLGKLFLPNWLTKIIHELMDIKS